MEKWVSNKYSYKSYKNEAHINSSSGLYEIDLDKELSRIKSLGYIKTMRKGDTGIGYTLETLLGLKETNKRGIGDISYKGIPTELKSQRKKTSSMMTLFTLEAEKGLNKDRIMIEKYGYKDTMGRDGLKVTLNTSHYVPQNLKLNINKEKDMIEIIDKDKNVLWYWNFNKLEVKIGSLAIIFADTKGSGENEQFHFNEAYYYNELDRNKLFDMFEDSLFVVDLRMHLRSNNTVRNHGTAFRLKGISNLDHCYNKIKKII